jgi:hypothetical protein
MWTSTMALRDTVCREVTITAMRVDGGLPVVTRVSVLVAATALVMGPPTVDDEAPLG